LQLFFEKIVVVGLEKLVELCPAVVMSF
jgi:hypothetical protein